MADIVDKEENIVQEAVQNIKISRGLRPELEFEFSKVENLFVYNETGNKIRFGDIYKKQKTIIVFVRHFLDFIAKEYVEDFAVIPVEYLQEADVRLVLIGPAPYRFIKSFKQATGYQQTLYCDPELDLYKTLGCPKKGGVGDLKGSKHVKSGFVMGILRSTWRAMREEARTYQGDVQQQGCALVVGPGDVLHYSHIDQSSTDHAPINELLKAAGVQAVSFPKDPRVQDL
ncbi:peroxiredoxin-like 2C [Gigantopelta aegis]|uniref:peroxiredoxin-like 2C n=1 Tax=Gigantopelta aegis TaxID=1735272 RepID=UPI001B889055|nr:peroxiredoxin-like 2C [Gigantopelta aegis]